MFSTSPHPLRRRSALAALVVSGGLLVGLTQPATAATAATVATPSAASAATDAKAVLSLINKERSSHGLRMLRMRPRLTSAAHRHDLVMANHNDLSHQLPGEPTFAAEVTAAGYHWRAVGENIGYNSDWSKSGVLLLEQLMYNEKPPNDDHRRNILNKAYLDVGIDVYMDAKHHKAWLTEIFAQPR